MAETEEPDSAWSPLRVAVFRGLWLAGLVSNLGTFMHTVAAGWAVTTLTDSPTLVSLVQAAWTVPGFLLALLAGALADVVDRRRLIIATQAASVLVAGVLGLLTLTDRLTVTLLVAFTFALSTVGTLAAPAFMAITPELVSPRELPKALGLNSISSNIGQSLGPALAGLVIAAAGPGAVFLLNAVSFVGIIAVFRRFRPPAGDQLPAEHLVAAMRTGVRYFRNSTRLQVLAARVVLAMTVTSALAALLPVIARTRLEASAAEFGLLSTAMGVGAVAAVSVLPRFRRRASPDVVVLTAAVVWALGVVGLVATRSLPVALVGMVLAGAGSMTTMNVVFSLYTVQLPSWVRGRAMSVAMLVIWLGASAGAVGWGALGSAVGIRTAMLVAAGVHVAVTAVAAVVLRLGDGEAVDVTPVVWAMPELQVPPAREAGPVLILIEWFIDPATVEEFTVAMAPIRRQRQRDGGIGWGLFHDLERPGRMVESYTVATWAEHERQHHRAIAADGPEQAAARHHLVDGDPRIHHLIAARPVGAPKPGPDGTDHADPTDSTDIPGAGP